MLFLNVVLNVVIWHHEHHRHQFPVFTMVLPQELLISGELTLLCCHHKARFASLNANAAAILTTAVSRPTKPQLIN